MKSVHTLASEVDVFANIRDSAPVELLGFWIKLSPFCLRGSDIVSSRSSIPCLPKAIICNGSWSWSGVSGKDIQSQEWVQVAVVGPGQTGKSSLLAALSRRQLAESKPIFTLVDIHDEYVGYKSDEALSEKLQDVDLILLILDGQYELSSSTKEMYERLHGLNKPVLVVLNKIDLVQTPREAIRAARKRLGTSVFATSALHPESIDNLLKTILDTDPKALFPLTQGFPDFRRSICHGIVSQAALSGAIVGAIRIPIADFLPVTAIQTGMLLKIARTFGCPLNRKEPGSCCHVGGWSCRPRGEPFAETPLSRISELISISVAGIGTLVLGHVAIQYFEGFSNFLNDDRPTDFPSPAMGLEIH